MTLNQVQKMTDEKIRLKMAELCGWTEICKDRIGTDDGGWEDLRWSGKKQKEDLCWQPIPLYTSDLNDMHEAERGCLTTVALQEEYVRILRDVSWEKPWVKADGWACFATAKQRAEAFLMLMDGVK